MRVLETKVYTSNEAIEQCLIDMEYEFTENGELL